MVEPCGTDDEDSAGFQVVGGMGCSHRGGRRATAGHRKACEQQEDISK
jgi:hypothetical protein